MLFSCGREYAFQEQREACAPVHLALDHFEPCNLPFDWTCTPRQAGGSSDCSLILLQTLCKGHSLGYAAVRTICKPRSQFSYMPLAHEAEKSLRERIDRGNDRLLEQHVNELFVFTRKIIHYFQQQLDKATV